MQRRIAEDPAAQRDRDCGQDGVCKLSPGCNRHLEEWNRELVRQRDEAWAFLRRTAMTGGSIVSSAAMTAQQIAIARAPIGCSSCPMATGSSMCQARGFVRAVDPIQAITLARGAIRRRSNCGDDRHDDDDSLGRPPETMPKSRTSSSPEDKCPSCRSG